MPYLSEKIKIAGTKFDRRIKLTEEQKKEIKELSSAGLSQRKIAAIYKVDRRLISFIVNPVVILIKNDITLLPSILAVNGFFSVTNLEPIVISAFFLT